jgi:hypothetical protein
VPCRWGDGRPKDISGDFVCGTADLVIFAGIFSLHHRLLICLISKGINPKSGADLVKEPADLSITRICLLLRVFV